MLRQVVLRVVVVLVACFCLPTLPMACDQHKKEGAVIPPIAQNNSDSAQTSAIESKATTAAPAVEDTAAVKPVTVLEFVLANQIEAREPKDIVENFKQSTEKAYAFARLSATQNSEVTFVWLREEKTQARFTTSVHASKKWRTFSSVKLRPGHWKVQLLLGQEVLAEKAFTVE